MNEKLKKVKGAKSDPKFHNSHRTSQNSGITLVALIITIIVLLILAVVAIRAVQGDGIISKAKEAKTKYEKAQSDEALKLLELEYQIASENPIKRNGIIPNGGVYYQGTELCGYCQGIYGFKGLEHGPANDGSYTFTKDPDVTLSPMDSFPETPETGDIYIEGDYIYTYNMGGEYGTEWSVRIEDRTKSSYGEIISEIAGKPVTSLSGAPGGEYYMGNGTFTGCKSLTTAPAIPNSVTNMKYAFFDCTSLIAAPVIPDSVTDMSHTFEGCTSLTTAPAIPSSVTNMPFTFGGCTSLTTAPVIPNSVTNLDFTFGGCTSLTTAPAIPNSVTSMNGTFGGCTSLTTAPAIPSSVTNMMSTFSGCTSLTAAPMIPSSVDLMNSTFDGCTSLTGMIEINVNWPKDVIDYAYYDCFYGTTQPIILTGSSNMLSELAGTANNGNVTVSE